MDLEFGSDSDVEEDQDELMQYLNPLQLDDSDGKPLPYDFTERLKTEGYIYEQIYVKNCYKKFRVVDFSPAVREEIRMCARRGRKDGRTCVKALIPISDELVMVKFKYIVYGNKEKGDSDDEEEHTESLTFKKGPFQK